MGNLSGFAKGLLIVALLVLGSVCAIAAIMFGIASFVGGWAYIALGALGVFGFCTFMELPRIQRFSMGCCSGIAGGIAWWVSASISGIAGAIAAVAAGTIACAVLLALTVIFIHGRD